jgi:hypothetical protein
MCLAPFWSSRLVSARKSRWCTAPIDAFTEMRLTFERERWDYLSEVEFREFSKSDDLQIHLQMAGCRSCS